MITMPSAYPFIDELHYQYNPSGPVQSFKRDIICPFCGRAMIATFHQVRESQTYRVTLYCKSVGAAGTGGQHGRAEIEIASP